MKNLLYGILLLYTLLSCSSNNKQLIMYIGNVDADQEEGISYCYFNSETGELSKPILTEKISKPIFLDIDKQNKVLYSVATIINPEDSSTTPSIINYSIDTKTAQLQYISQAPTYGKDPCFIEYNQTKNKLLVANYSSGNTSSYHLNNKSIQYEETYLHFGDGPNKGRQQGPHAHSIRFSPNNNYAYAADLGSDKIMIYQNNATNMQIADSIITHPGAGPRHIDFSPDAHIMAIVNELDCTISTYEKDSTDRYKKFIETITMLPDTFNGYSKAADIHFSPDGKFLYASNRGFNSIAIYKVEAKKLTFVGLKTEGINWPRNFAIDPTGKFILVANRDSDNITVYRRNIQDGTLEKLNFVAEIKNPVCLKFFNH